MLIFFCSKVITDSSGQNLTCATPASSQRMFPKAGLSSLRLEDRARETKTAFESASASVPEWMGAIGPGHGQMKLFAAAVICPCC